MIRFKKDSVPMARTRSFATLLAVGALAAACTHTNPEIAARHNPTLYSVHQPVVQRTDYALELATAGNGLGSNEARLRAWFDALQIGYGDRISIEQAGYVDPAVRQDVARVAESYGLLLSDGAPVTAGSVQPGLVRVVVSRASASVPGCPDWAYAQLPGAPTSTDSNYGCAINSNLAAMIADPNDLIAGREAEGGTDPAVITKTIRAYRDRAGSGAAGTVSSPGAGQ